MARVASKEFARESQVRRVVTGVAGQKAQGFLKWEIYKSKTVTKIDVHTGLHKYFSKY